MQVLIRIPLIPQFNTAREETQRICGHLYNMGISEVELLPFHRLGSAKYEAMGLAYAYKATPPLTSTEILHIEAVYKTYYSVKTEQ